jgi:hypothetical protein
LFAPGIFLEYLGHPKKTANYIKPVAGVLSLENAYVIGLDSHLDDPITVTSVEDIAGIVAGAVDYPGKWPVMGGISGQRTSLREIHAIGEKVMGKF